MMDLKAALEAESALASLLADNYMHSFLWNEDKRKLEAALELIRDLISNN